MRILKGEKDVMFGGCHIILVGNFFQLLPDGSGIPLFKCKNYNLVLLIKDFLNVSHRFINDPAYGGIMRRFRAGLSTINDIKNKCKIY